MPTKRQYSRMREVDFEFFGKNSKEKSFDSFSGEVIGTLEYNEKTGDLKVNVNKDQKDSELPNKAQ